MCVKRKQFKLDAPLIGGRFFLLAIFAFCIGLSGPIGISGFGFAAEPEEDLSFGRAKLIQSDRLAIGAALGDASGGVTDRVFVAAPPYAAFVVERASGSFVDCGAGMSSVSVDADGRTVAELPCGVTLTETLFVPTAAASAKVYIHF